MAKRPNHKRTKLNDWQMIALEKGIEHLIKSDDAKYEDLHHLLYLLREANFVTLTEIQPVKG